MKSSNNRLENGYEIKDLKLEPQIASVRTEVSTVIEQSILRDLRKDGLINENEYMAALCELRKLSDKQKEDKIS